MRGNQAGGNGAEAACVSGSAGQVVNYLPYQLTGVHEVDVIDSLGPAIFYVLHQDGTTRRKQQN